MSSEILLILPLPAGNKNRRLALQFYPADQPIHL
jgi:hypothetical protein